MNVVPIRREDAEVPADEPVEGAHRAAARRRASSLAELPPGGTDQRVRVPPSGDAGSPGRGSAAAAGARLREVASRPLIHLPAPAMSALWARHQEAAWHWDAGVIRWPRQAWAVMHVAVTGLVYGLLWVTFSPAGFAALGVLVAACWFWL